MKSLDSLPKAIDIEEKPQEIHTASGEAVLLPHEMRAAQAGRALTNIALIDFDYIPSGPEGAGGQISKWNPHQGSVREFNEYQRAAHHSGDPVQITLRKNPRYRKGLVTKIVCDIDKWPEAPFKSLVIKEGKDQEVKLKKERNPHVQTYPDYLQSSVDISGRDVDDMSRHADTLVAADFLLKRAVEGIYESKIRATSRHPGTQVAEV